MEAVGEAQKEARLLTLVTIQALDPTIGLTERAKYFVVCTGSMDLNTRNIYLRHVLRGRYEVPEQVRLLRQLYADWKPLYLGIEETFWQTSLIQLLRDQSDPSYVDMPILPIDRRKQGNKDTANRALALAFRYEQKQIFHPARVDKHGRDTGVSAWLDPFEEELLAFTGQKGRDEYSDQVSAWADVVHGLVSLATYRLELDYTPRSYDFSYDGGAWVGAA